MMEDTKSNVYIQIIGDEEILLMPEKVEMTENENENLSCSQNENPLELNTSWSNEATKLFLELWSERKDKFRNPAIKRKILFTEISREMRKLNYSFTQGEIERKFRNMKKYYLTIKEHNSKTGRPRKSWCFYKAVGDIFAEDKAVNPPAPTESSTECSSPSTSRLEYSQEPSRSPAGFDFIQEHFPDTEMLPEDATSGDVIDAVKRRRLSRHSNENAIKAVRKPKNPATLELLKLEEDRNKEIRGIREAMQRSNQIQQERNDLLKSLLDKL